MATLGARGRSHNTGSVVLRYKFIATHLLIGAVCFYAGIGVGVRIGFIDCSEICKKQELRIANMRGGEGDFVGGRDLNANAVNVPCEKQPDNKQASSATGSRFPTNVAQFATGVSEVTKLCKRKDQTF